MMIRTRAILFIAITIIGSMLCVSYGFAQGPVTLTAAGNVTKYQSDLLAEHGLTPDQLEGLNQLVSSARGKVEFSVDRKMKVPDFIKAEIPVPEGITKAEDKGYHFLKKYKKLYRIKSARQELKLVKAKKNRRGQENIRYQQYYRDIKVVGAEMLVHIKPDNKLWFMQGKYVADIDMSTTPAVRKESVLDIIGNDFIERHGADKKITISIPEPGVLNPWVFDRQRNSKNVLIWIAAVTDNATGRTWTYYVNAQNGLVLDVMDSARYIDSEVWDRQNTGASGDDELWYRDNNKMMIIGSTVDPDTTAVNTFTTEFWNYLYNEFGVYSLDSSSTADGMQMIGNAYSVDMTCPNACWNCVVGEAIFCEDMATRDIVVHEYTHGLIQNSGGGLTYRNQSGALNESFADVFGEFLDMRAGATDWLHGQSRDMSNPLNRRTGDTQDPDHVGETGASTDHPAYWPHCDPSVPGGCDGNDRGGVHHNSGVPNIVAYLIVNGTQPDDPHYNFHIKGIGLNKTEQLYYETLVDAGLSSSADFVDARNTMVSVCNDFATGGTHGFTTNDCCQVRNAWSSVGVGTACSALSTSTWGTLSSNYSPYFVRANTTIPLTRTLTVPSNVDIYFFPNTKLTATGLLDADGTSGDVRFLSSRDTNSMILSHQHKLMNGGEIKMPVQTFGSHDTRPHGLTIRDDVEASSYIRIDNGFTVTDINVTLNITHGNDSDLTVTLESPGGTSVVLFSGVGGIFNHFTNTVLDDEAAVSITAGAAPFTGSFQPQNALSAFDGENTEGYWRLRVSDAAGGGFGSLESWEMTF